MRIYLIFLFLTFGSLNSIAQQAENRFLPVQLYQFCEFYSLTNPARSSENFKYDINVGHRGYAYEGITNHMNYLNAQAKFYQKYDRIHNVGLSFIGISEGQYFKKNQVMVSYAWHMPVGKKNYLSVGLALGAFNYAVGATQLSAGANSMTSTGNAGILLYNDQFFCGASVNQLTNGRVVPINEVTRLSRHYNVVCGKIFHLNHYISLKSALLIRYVNNPINDSERPFPQIYFGTLLGGLFSAGAVYQYKNGMALTAGLEGIYLNDNKLNIFFSYQVYSTHARLNLRTYEIGLGFYIKEKRSPDKLEEDDSE
ncbi:MAG: type IX secretion system membrane protein PorP/SprF [Sporocytophaga sp.]|uniref:type IX secretion system membrane protein PorP/SprF n=1 Tax=Sporocytophaga sp. TaxID=2231183 RepID=UPI001AFE465C|nr:type IX secretion system membrane protein PorP/SprF [Sporocytophaga sp.]MBO9703843.1 type IX secretion system membrane protein PorP/SprF [Sporocytophaga sp.]